MKNIVKVPDLRKKIFFTIFIIAIYRVGARVPVPGVDFSAIQELTDAANNSNGGIASYLQLFSGGAITHVAVFGLGIMPYITASIIMQLLTVVIPKLEQWRNEGVTGQKKITQATRYLTLVLSIMQATGLVVALHNNTASLGVATNTPLITKFDIPHVLLIVLTMTSGTAIVMWLGELITQRGIGQGMSLLMFANVVSSMPANFNSVRAAKGLTDFIILLAVAVALMVCIIFVEQGQRRIPVQFAKRVVGKRQYGGQSTYIPLKVNQSGVIPIVFASAVLGFPIQLAAVFPNGVRTWINNNLASPRSLTYVILYGLLIILFAYFYSRITFDPAKQADIIRKQGGYIPGIRPGRPTELHLGGILNRITLPGSLFLAAVALLPSLFLALWHVQNYPFAGTSILIAVGVALETMKQVDSQLTMRNYEGFLK